MGRPKYYMLMASLPPVAPLFTLFTETRTPISRRRLEKRLEMLEPEDASELASLQDIMHWHRLPMETADRDIVERAERTLQRVRSQVLREVASWRMEMRSIVAALRRRAAGEPPPARGEKWAATPRAVAMVRNWSRLDFGLSALHPWVAAVEEKIRFGDAAAVERIQLAASFSHLARMGDRHDFDFEAVALYVLRWDIVHRWTSYDAGEAERRYEEMVEQGLAAGPEGPSSPREERGE